MVTTGCSHGRTTGRIARATASPVTSKVVNVAITLAKARFRNFSGRFSRRTRFPRRAPWAKGRGEGKRGGSKGRGKGKGFPIGHSFTAKGLPARALAGGKGKAGNPRDPSGAVLRCHRCGSQDHMMADCPKGKGKGGGRIRRRRRCPRARRTLTSPTDGDTCRSPPTGHAAIGGGSSRKAAAFDLAMAIIAQLVRRHSINLRSCLARSRDRPAR